MHNSEIAKIFLEISEYLYMREVPFKPRAYEKAASAIFDLEESLEKIYKTEGIKGLKKIPGVGDAIAKKIGELIRTGKLKYYEELKKETPVKVDELTRIEGIGPKSIKKLYEKLGVKNINDLEKAARMGKIRKLEGFGEKTEENIISGIQFLKEHFSRFSLGYIIPLAESLKERLDRIPGSVKVVVAGSYRRRKETVGDLDILAVSKKPSAIMKYFVTQHGVKRVLAHGSTKSSVRLDMGIDVDIRVVPGESYGAALAYFTGSKAHNVSMREIAQKMGLKLNEYGLFRGTKMIAGKSEEGIYRALRLDYVEPEMREDAGEIYAAKQHKLPKLIEYGSVRGDLQVQSDWSDGSNSIEELARAALKAGLEYIAITDHTKRLAMANGLDTKRIRKQMLEIDRVNKKLRGAIKILKGTECDILKDGLLDLPDSVLKDLDVVGVSVHSLFNLSRNEQTERIKRAMSNPNINILFHPTGRLINKRKPYEIDIDAIIKEAKKFGVVLEINAHPDRLDLCDEHIKKCVEAGVKMVINSDAHASLHFGYLDFGVAQARRGWATNNDIINVWPLDKCLNYLKRV